MPEKTKKQIIYEVAAECFRDKGYTASSVREIADRVGLEPSSLYSHIRSKEEILIRVCKDCAELYHSKLDEICGKIPDAERRISAIIEMHIDIALNDPTSITVFNDEWRHLPESEKHDFLISRKSYEQKLRGIIKDGIELGAFRPMDANIAVNLMISSMRWIHYQNNTGTSSVRIQMKAQVQQWILKALTL